MAGSLIPPRGRVLGRLDDIPDGRARGFGPAPGSYTGLLAVRRGEAVFVYVNCCPHVGTPLDWTPDRFLTADGDRRLESVKARIEEGMIVVGED